MRGNRYVHGMQVLGARRRERAPAHVLGGFNWAQLAQAFGVYTGQSLNPMDLLNTSESGSGGYAGHAGVAQNPYWAQQRQVQPLAASNLARQQAAQQLQTALRQQQAANLAALQQQLAQMPQRIATAYAPPSPQSYAPSGYPLAQGTSATDGGAPLSSDDSLDATTVMGAAVDPQYLVIKVKNLTDVIAKQGGALANLGYALTPQTIANVVYGQMAEQFKAKMASEGVDADVTVTADPPRGAPPSGDMLAGVVVGAGAVGLGALLWKFVIKGLFK